MAHPSAELIRGIAIFSDLDDASVQQLADDFIERRVRPRRRDRHGGRGGLNFFVIESGTADVSVGGTGVGTLGPGAAVRRDRAGR